MPDIGWMHPQVVHFVVALAFVGVPCRVISLLPLGRLTERLRFTGPMAAALIIMAALASLVAVHSGLNAHDPVERVPGARTAVTDHEEAGEWARNALVALALLEIGALVLAAKPAARWVKVGSGVVGLVALATVFDAAEHGGELVYGYAGGVGIRSGDTTDVRRLLVAGLYHNVQQVRAAGRGADAARLVDELARQMPADTGVRFMVIESRLRDRADTAGALAALDSVDPGESRRFRRMKESLTAAAHGQAPPPSPSSPSQPPR